MEESKRIILNTGHVSLERELGPYYIDMRPALIHYQHNIWGGCFDKNGVPMCADSDGNLFYSPVNVFQFGFILHSTWVANKDNQIVQQLQHCIAVLDNLKTEQDGHCVWYYHQNEERYHLKPPWPSAMAQGEAISFYLRMYQLFHREEYLETANKAYNFLKIDTTHGGVRRRDKQGFLWFEEYPSEPPSYVLNGFIYTLLGLFDLFRVLADPEVKKDIDACLVTLKNRLPMFDCGYWSVYDLRFRELVRYYYQQNVHVIQMEILFRLTNEQIFLKYKNKWERNISPRNYLFVQLMYRLQPRFRRIFKGDNQII